MRRDEQAERDRELGHRVRLADLTDEVERRLRERERIALDLLRRRPRRAARRVT